MLIIGSNHHLISQTETGVIFLLGCTVHIYNYIYLWQFHFSQKVLSSYHVLTSVVATLLLGTARGCPGSIWISPVWLERYVRSFSTHTYTFPPGIF